MAEYRVDVMWDDEAHVWVATSDDIGLCLESDSLDKLQVEIPVAIEELREVAGELSEQYAVDMVSNRKLVFA